MDFGDIIGDAIAYPAHNVKSLLLYIIIGVIGGIFGGASLAGMLASVLGENLWAAGGFGVIGIIIWCICALLISGYTLDIVGLGIERSLDGPRIDFVRQVVNGIKSIIVGIVYFIVPALIIWALISLLGSGTLIIFIALMLAILFAFAEFMAKCRLAKYDSLSEALAIREAIRDISRAGLMKSLITIAAVVVIGMLIAMILSIIFGYDTTVGGIVLGIFGVYYVFFYNRAIGLLYSDV